MENFNLDHFHSKAKFFGITKAFFNIQGNRSRKHVIVEI
jgi:hypothetical protein